MPQNLTYFLAVTNILLESPLVAWQLLKAKKETVTPDTRKKKKGQLLFSPN